MTERKTPLKPSRIPTQEDRENAVRRAEAMAARLRAKRPGRKFSDSTEIIREYRDR